MIRWDKVSNFQAVLFDWRGTLAVTLSGPQWVQEGLRRAGRQPSEEDAKAIFEKIHRAPSFGLLSAEDIDSDAAVHRDAYAQIFRDAGLDQDLARELYAVESDADYNPLAADVGAVFQEIKRRDVRIGVISDIHFDIRPAFDRAGLLPLIELFVLSFEHGVQKPQPDIFQVALDALRLDPGDVLMVGDRAAYDGAAVQLGVVSLLLPPLRSVADVRLHLVTALLA
jgi:HAD superfamily hydrolase (TIGR01549 family)